MGREKEGAEKKKKKKKRWQGVQDLNQDVQYNLRVFNTSIYIYIYIIFFLLHFCKNSSIFLRTQSVHLNTLSYKLRCHWPQSCNPWSNVWSDVIKLPFALWEREDFINKIIVYAFPFSYFVLIYLFTISLYYK